MTKEYMTIPILNIMAGELSMNKDNDSESISLKSYWTALKYKETKIIKFHNRISPTIFCQQH